jgi:Flp pilus assembly pilin Flp
MSGLEFREVVATLPEREEGQTMAEYGVALAVITVATVAIFTALGGAVEGAIQRVITLLPS